MALELNVQKRFEDIQNEVNVQIQKQVSKYGLQSMPDVTDCLVHSYGLSSENSFCDAVRTEYGLSSESWMKHNTELAHQSNRLTYAHILAEEVSEVICAKTIDAKREELIQVAAVAISWIEKLDRERKQETQISHNECIVAIELNPMYEIYDRYVSSVNGKIVLTSNKDAALRFSDKSSASKFIGTNLHVVHTIIGNQVDLVIEPYIKDQFLTIDNINAMFTRLNYNTIHIILDSDELSKFFLSWCDDWFDKTVTKASIIKDAVSNGGTKFIAGVPKLSHCKTYVNIVFDHVIEYNVIEC